MTYFYTYDTVVSTVCERGDEMATINIRDIPNDIHRRAKAQAAMEGVSLKELVIRLLTEYLEKTGGK